MLIAVHQSATRRAAEHAAGEPLWRHRERVALCATNDNCRIRLVVDNTALNQSFGYDANDRLTSWTGAWGITELYSYDANGNRRTFSVTGQTLATLAYPSSSNKFTSQTGGAMPYTPAYDATGNITSVGGIAYAYDGRNLLASSTGSGITTNYWVNDLGQRVRKTWYGSSASHVVFSYEPGGRHLGSYSLTGGVTEETVFLGDTPVGMMVGGTNYYVYGDHLDAPRTVTNTSNQSRWEWDEADPYGRILPDQNPSGLGTFNWRRGFPGQFYDAEKSAWHNGWRTYHAAFGRYLQPDPIGLAAGDFSNYSYVGGNPVSRVDPLGLYSKVTRVGNRLIVSVDIGISGEANQALAKTIESEANKKWNSQKWKYGNCDVTFSFSVNYLKNADNIVNIGGRGTSKVWGPAMATGNWYIDDHGDYVWSVAPHEVGHFMNLIDRYDPVFDAQGNQMGTIPWNDKRGDWRGNIMGERGGGVDLRNVIDAVNSANERNGDCTCEE